MASHTFLSSNCDVLKGCPCEAHWQSCHSLRAWVTYLHHQKQSGHLIYRGPLNFDNNQHHFISCLLLPLCHQSMGGYNGGANAFGTMEGHHFEFLASLCDRIHWYFVKKNSTCWRHWFFSRKAGGCLVLISHLYLVWCGRLMSFPAKITTLLNILASLCNHEEMEILLSTEMECLKKLQQGVDHVANP